MNSPARAPATANPAAIAYTAALEVIAAAEPGIAAAIVGELASQRRQLKLIASETTLGFGTSEMDEIADIITTALHATTVPSAAAKAKYILDAQVAAGCRTRCADLLSRHPLYPGIEL